MRQLQNPPSTVLLYTSAAIAISGAQPRSPQKHKEAQARKLKKEAQELKGQALSFAHRSPATSVTQLTARAFRCADLLFAAMLTSSLGVRSFIITFKNAQSGITPSAQTPLSRPSSARCRTLSTTAGDAARCGAASLLAAIRLLRFRWHVAALLAVAARVRGLR